MDLNNVERKPVTLVISYSSQKSSSHNRFDWVQTMLNTTWHPFKNDVALVNMGLERPILRIHDPIISMASNHLHV